MADKTQNVKTRLSFDGEAEYKAACKEINSTLTRTTGNHRKAKQAYC